VKLALLGRDGVINVNRGSGGVVHRTQLQLITGSIDAIATLCQAGYSVVILTHQPGLSRGLFDLDEMEAIHSQITHAVEEAGGSLSGIFYCPHDTSDRCHCRPPSTGLLDVIEMELDCDTEGCFYFCHTEAEIAAARRKHSIPIQCGGNSVEGIPHYEHLLAAVTATLQAPP